MAQSGDKSGRARGDAGTRASDAGRTLPHALPSDLAGALRRLDDAQLDRLRKAVAAEARRRGCPDGRTSEPERRRRAAPVTPGQERLVLAAFESGVRPAAIARELVLSRARVEAVVAAAKQGRR